MSILPDSIIQRRITRDAKVQKQMCQLQRDCKLTKGDYRLRKAMTCKHHELRIKELEE